MYTIFFTINCVEHLTFSKTFVDQLQFEQLIFLCLKVKLLESSWSPKINWIRPVDKKVKFAWIMLSSWKIVLTAFFELSNFEQLIMSRIDVMYSPSIHWLHCNISNHSHKDCNLVIKYILPYFKNSKSHCLIQNI
jgi:hypothetical protein